MLSDEAQITFEVNIGKGEWLFVNIYEPQSQNTQYFLDTGSCLLGFHSQKCGT